MFNIDRKFKRQIKIIVGGISIIYLKNQQIYLEVNDS